MSRPIGIPVWKKAPFTRLLIPLIAGIMLQWYFQISITFIAAALIFFCIAFFLFLLLPIALRFTLKPLQGFIIQLLFIGLGMLLTWQKDIRHNKNWYGNHYSDSSYLLVRIDEPLVEKNRSFKAEGYVESIIEKGKTIPGNGKLLLYFSKDSFQNDLHYGDRILIHKNIQRIKNSGNPGAFDYERYAALRGLFHQVFLKQNEWLVIDRKNIDPFRQFIFSAREKVLAVLRNNILTGKDELGIAEALLIGYTEDLDKDLVQAYSNTGVVHIIAISGMHLGLIYVLLVWIFTRIPFVKRSKTFQLVLILGCLWLFAILTGASPSVLRAAVMFSFIAIGKNFFKQASVYNSLAASAFVLLCYNPYYLWAVGFQLSYLAVLGIVIFQKPFYHCFYIKNKLLNKVWELMCISTAAQLLTFPVCTYYFHQFPNLFLFTNLVAVPLSTIILYAALALAAFSWIPVVGIYLGKLTGWLTWCMNAFILWVDGFSFAVWDKIPATVFSACLLYAAIIACSVWLIQKNKKYFSITLAALFVFVVQDTFHKWQTFRQQKLIIYHVPRLQAIDIVQGNRYRFTGDSILLEDASLQNFHLKPGRIKHQLLNRTDSLNGVFTSGMFMQVQQKKVLLINRPVIFDTVYPPIEIDLVVLSGNPKLNMAMLSRAFTCKQIVFDASNPLWKIEKWAKECSELKLRFHSIPASGAFIYNVGI